jgi:hypothetical protein
MKLEGERRERCRGDETYRCFQVVGNRVKPPLSHSSRFMGAGGDGSTGLCRGLAGCESSSAAGAVAGSPAVGAPLL